MSGVDKGALAGGAECEVSCGLVRIGVVELVAALEEEEEAAEPRRVCLGGLRGLAGAVPWDRNCRSQCATKSMKWSSVGVRRRPGRLLCQIAKR